MFAFLSVSPMQFHNGYPGDRREWPIDRKRLGLGLATTLTPTPALKQYSKKIDPDPELAFY